MLEIAGKSVRMELSNWDVNAIQSYFFHLSILKQQPHISNAYPNVFMQHVIVSLL